MSKKSTRFEIGDVVLLTRAVSWFPAGTIGTVTDVWGDRFIDIRITSHQSEKWDVLIPSFDCPKKIKLKGCPFCGSDAMIDAIWKSPADENPNSYRIVCKKCKAQTAIKPKAEKAVKAWNTRNMNS